MEAQTEADKISSLDPVNPDVFVLRWRIRAWLGKWEEAHHLAREFIQGVPNRPTGWLCLAYSLFKLRRPLEAYLHLLDQAKVFPQASAIAYFLGCCCVEMGDRRRAKGWLAKARALAAKEGNQTPLFDFAGLDANRNYLPSIAPPSPQRWPGSTS